MGKSAFGILVGSDYDTIAENIYNKSPAEQAEIVSIMIEDMHTREIEMATTLKQSRSSRSGWTGCWPEKTSGK